MQQDLARFYDRQADERAARPLDPERVRRRGEFLALLADELRTRVVELGTGPGLDGAAMIDAGCSVAGVDLSARNVELARQRGVEARQAQLHELPFAAGSFDAGWSMSVLLHLADAEVDAALVELRRVLVGSAPVAIGLWGGRDFAGINEHDQIEPKRWFRYRTHDHLRALLEPHLTIERFDVWPDPFGLDLEYQWVLGRV